MFDNLTTENERKLAKRIEVADDHIDKFKSALGYAEAEKLFLLKLVEAAREISKHPPNNTDDYARWLMVRQALYAYDKFKEMP